MKHHLLKIRQFNDIRPAVSGRVFHATSIANIRLIREVGAIVPNSELLHHSMFGNFSNGFFRQKGCVSFFDYRNFGTKNWEDYAYKCFPSAFLKQGEKMSILFLRESEYAKLISWKTWKEEEAWSQRIVPWIEAGYKGEVSLESISEELIVEYTSDY